MDSEAAIVIVGAGQAGQQLATELRRLGHVGPISLYGDERYPPYQRPPLSKQYLCGAVADEELFLEEPGYYERQNIRLLQGAPVAAIDRATKRIVLSSGEQVAYDHLVLATGAYNRRLPPITCSSAHVHSLRSLDDSRRLRAAVGRARKMLVIGGGFLGLEVAALATQQGVNVHVVEMMGRLLDRSVSPLISRAVRRQHAGAGIAFHFNRSVAAVEELRRGLQVRLDDGKTFDVDCVVAAVGILPNIALAVKAGLAVDDGILVNSQLLTSDPAISAIGDCCSYPHVGAGHRHMRMESVQNAVGQACYVARRLTGRADVSYAEVPIFWSDQSNLRIQIAGVTQRTDLSVVYGDASSKAFSVFRYCNNKLVCVESLNRPADHRLARQLLSGGISPPISYLADPTFDMNPLLGLVG